MRILLSFGGLEGPFRGVIITKDCIGCGECLEKCTFKAINLEGDDYIIDHNKCDVCGDCHTVCSSDAIKIIQEEGSV